MVEIEGTIHERNSGPGHSHTYALPASVGREVGIDFAFDRITVQPTTPHAHRKCRTLLTQWTFRNSVPAAESPCAVGGNLMPRCVRLETRGAQHHVILRGRRPQRA